MGSTSRLASKTSQVTAANELCFEYELIGLKGSIARLLLILRAEDRSIYVFGLESRLEFKY